MTNRIGRWCVLLSAVGGCASSSVSPSYAANPPAGPAAPAAAAPDERVMARVATNYGDVVITREQVLRPLIEAHGLGMLLQIMQLEMAKKQAVALHVSVSADDLKSERTLSLDPLYESADAENDKLIEEARKANKPTDVAKFERKKARDRELLLQKLFEQQHMTAGEFDIALETRAYLRKVAEPFVRASITEDMLRQEYAVKYNEQVRIKHIQLDGRDALRKTAVIKQRLAAGEEFGKLAREFSTNQNTAALDGDVPPFALANPGLPPTFKDAAFALKPGEVSGVINIDSTYQIIKLIERIAPKAMEFEKVRDGLSRGLIERATVLRINQIRTDYATAVADQLKTQIEDPVLRKQFNDKIEAAKRVDPDQVLTDAQAAARAATQRAATQRAATLPSRPVGQAPSLRAPTVSATGGEPTSGTAPAFGSATAPTRPAAASQPAIPPSPGPIVAPAK